MRKVQTGCRKRKASFLSHPPTDPQHRVNALESTLHILQSRHEKLEHELRVKRKGANVGGKGLLNKGGNDNRGGGVVFLYNYAKEKNRRINVARGSDNLEKSLRLQEQKVRREEG
jgi:hypothetical protein